MALLFYSELGKLSIEYLQFNTITNIEYKNEFQQDKLFISFFLEHNIPYSFIKFYYSNYSNIRKFYSDINKNGTKCLDSFNLKNIQDNISNEEIISINFICYNITFNQIMNKHFFYDYYLRYGIDIQSKHFINSGQYSIGYLTSQKIKKDKFPLKPVVSLRLNNVKYDQLNNSVSKLKMTLKIFNITCHDINKSKYISDRFTS